MAAGPDPAQRPRIWLPPPLLFAAGLMAAWGLERWRPMPIVAVAAEPAVDVAGWVLIAVGLCLAGWAMATFSRERTPVLPLAPARVVVNTGPYRFSRNPIYLGLIVVHAGAALTMNSGWALTILPLAVLVLYYLVIRVEEAHMRARFGETYEAYRRRVRRWL